MKKIVIITFMLILNLGLLGCNSKEETPSNRYEDSFSYAQKLGFIGDYNNWIDMVKLTELKLNKNIILEVKNGILMYRLEDSTDLIKVENPYNIADLEELEEECKVTFILDNGKDDIVVKVKKGTKVARPSDPIKDNFRFENWTYRGVFWNFDDLILKDICLRAKYIWVAE